MGLDRRLRPGQCSPEQLCPVLLGGHLLPSPAQEMEFSANQCHGVKSSVKCSLVYGAPWGGWAVGYPLGPRTRALAQAPPLTAELDHHPLEPSCQFQDDSRSSPPDILFWLIRNIISMQGGKLTHHPAAC